MQSSLMHMLVELLALINIIIVNKVLIYTKKFIAVKFLRGLVVIAISQLLDLHKNASYGNL